MAQLEVVNSASLVNALEYHGIVNIYNELREVLFERILDSGINEIMEGQVSIECNFAHLYERRDVDTVGLQFNFNREVVYGFAEDDFLINAEWTGHINFL
ncbi:hypothetical protein GCM10008931_31360 [Oceanobacillus oncorhynchi subsp. oncorhynchi]|uniref:hypothetical protein n=1 Tax=Oceanobacillus oncorhynchi TaxID=545501 RepID=UPI0031D1D5C4